MYIKNPEYFITTVREGSISKAAEKLYLSQAIFKPVYRTNRKGIRCQDSSIAAICRSN
mgnify:CR=1 FL=1